MDERDDSRTGVAEVLAFLAALYPQFKLTRATIHAYEEVLGDIPPELLKAAARHVGSRSAFFPAAAELRQAVFELGIINRGVPTGYEAWQQVKGQFNGRRPALHPLARRALERLGGLEAFGQSALRDEPSWRARFLEAYEQLLEQEEVARRMLPQVRAMVEMLPPGREEEGG